jgi:hypothetical protein
MYRDDLAATHARLEQLQRELADAQSNHATDKQRIAALTAQLAATQQALQRLGAMPQPGYGNYVLPPRGTTILVLGILSLVVCSFLGPVAWAMGNEEIRRIDNGQVDPMSRGSVTAGRVCGIVATAMMILAVVIVIGMFAMIGTAASRY